MPVAEDKVAEEGVSSNGLFLLPLLAAPADEFGQEIFIRLSERVER
jgi:hypothetical protein